MKKIFLLVLSLGMILLIGCGGKKETKSEKTELTYMIWSTAQQPAMQRIIDTFEETNPSIDVTLEVYPWGQYWAKLDALAEANKLPDLFWMHIERFTRYNEASVMLDITDRVNKEIDITKYEPVVTSIYKDGEKYFGLPKDIDSLGIWYNKKMFDEAGIPRPTEAMTWDEFLSTAKKLTDAEKGIYGFAADLHGQKGQDNIIFQNNGYVVSDDKKTSGMDSPETMEAIKWYTDLILKEHVSPTLPEMIETSPLDMLLNGQVAMSIQGSWHVNAIGKNEYGRENIDSTYLMKGKRSATIANGLGNVIGANTEDKEASWKFLKYLSSKEAMLIQAEEGAAIPAYKEVQKEWINANTNFNLKIFIDELAYGVPHPNSKTRNIWAEDEKRIFAKVWTGEVSVEDGCREYAKKMNELLATE